MTPEERAEVARATAAEWERLADLTDYAPVLTVCVIKARQARAEADRLDPPLIE